MNLKIFFLFNLPITITHAAISYRVKVARNEEDCEITVKGRDVRPVGEQDQTVFQITEGQLKDLIELKVGRTPEDVFVKNPTPFGTFEKYGFVELKKITEPVKAAILGIESVPVIVTSQKLVNKSKKKLASFSAGISQTVETSTSSSWSTGGELSVGVEVSYDFSFASVGFSMGYAASWGEETGKSEARTVGAQSGLSVDLEPGQAIFCKMTASRGTLNAEVDYHTTITGQVFANFNPEFEGHHFIAYYISELLFQKDLSFLVKSKEIIKVGFFSDATVEIEDLKK